MMKPVVVLGAEMSAAAVLERLAAQGFWTSPADPAAQRRLAPVATRLNQPVEFVARRLAHDPRSCAAAIRRQWGTRVLWYARELTDVLAACQAAAPNASLLEVLGLHESDAQPVMQFRRGGDTALVDGVMIDDGRPVAASVGNPPELIGFLSAPSQERLAIGDLPSAYVSRGSPSAAAVAVARPAPIPAWPRIDSPQMVAAGQIFDVVVGFGTARQEGVSGAQVMIPAPPGATQVQVSVELSAGPQVRAPNGWTRPMTVLLDNVTAAQVVFQLVGVEPADPATPSLTTLEVRYVLDGTICGTAAKPLVIVPATSLLAPAIAPQPGEWHARPSSATPIVLVADEFAPDLTIEITKPDRNASSGAYMCQLVSPHPLTSPRGPFPMDLGQDAKTYAKSIVEEIRVFANSALLDNTIEAIGRTVSQCLPREVFDALGEVARRVAPAAPAVLIVSAEPYVPWELAWLEAPLDPARPSYLGAQALLGRWLRDADATAGAATAPRPATQPIAHLPVRHMAVMAAWYKAESGLRRLEEAEKEAKTLVTTYGGVALAATAQAMRQLLNATLERDFEAIGGPQAVHFAGHGDFDPGRPEGSALFLMDGTPLRSTLFRTAKYGGEHQPLLFLNACMLGIGGELLGDMAGFPGNSLRGGFGGVLGALWEVDDSVAHALALEFWQRALPAAPAQGEPVAKILQDLRAKYQPNGAEPPISTYLAYVYYGHPRLRLERAAA